MFVTEGTASCPTIIVMSGCSSARSVPLMVFAKTHTRPICYFDTMGMCRANMQTNDLNIGDDIREGMAALVLVNGPRLSRDRSYLFIVRQAALSGRSQPTHHKGNVAKTPGRPASCSSRHSANRRAGAFDRRLSSTRNRRLRLSWLRRHELEPCQRESPSLATL